MSKDKSRDKHLLSLVLNDWNALSIVPDFDFVRFAEICEIQNM